jgi:hypothetical protein
MNRLVRLFQQKANNAWDKYLDERKKAGGFTELNTPEWHASIGIGIKWKTQAETWEAAAKLLRQEELNR